MPKSSWWSSWWSSLHYVGLFYQCQSHTPYCGQSLSHCEGVMWAYLCASVCIFQLVTNAGEIQMSQNYQCPVQCREVIIYSLCTKLPSNLALFITSLWWNHNICGTSTSVHSKWKIKKTIKTVFRFLWKHINSVPGAWNIFTLIQPVLHFHNGTEEKGPWASMNCPMWPE